MDEVHAKQGKVEETIPQKLSRIKKELGEIEKELKIIEEDKGQERMRELEFDSNTIKEMGELKEKLAEIVKSKGLIQWEGAALNLSSSGISQKLTDDMLKAFSVLVMIIE
eukprot:TRINITY_DN2748_c0_g1_i18.p3 TRINITY_DN2748_c0_g1~~TRINITY_DN2748_c0_g1_i18.p3  ORF type:complete len:110 (-),score=35.49 TRINITY_DN2748_c0_g1_i18:142-471(-)